MENPNFNVTDTPDSLADFVDGEADNEFIPEITEVLEANELEDFKDAETRSI